MMNMNVFIIYLTGMISLVLSTSPAAAQQGLSAGEFVSQAKNSHAYEIASGKLALEKSRDGRVREFAEQVIDSHSRAVMQLDETLQAAGIPPAQQAPVHSAPAGDEHADSLPQADHNVMINALQDAEVQGNAFNQVYLNDQVRVLDETVNIFRQYADGGDNPQLAAYAKNMLETLQQHHTEARRLLQSVKTQ